jgi:hypothetical protein
MKENLQRVHYGSCKIELYIERRFNSALVGRNHIGQMIGLIEL